MKHDPRHARLRLLLRGSLQLVAATAAFAVVGAVMGLLLAELTGDNETAEPTPKTSARDRPGQDALGQVRVTVVSAILHPAATLSGQRRRRGRLSVHIKVHNSGSAVALAAPSLLAARQRIHTRSRGGLLAAARTLDFTVRFETKGAVTDELRTQKRGRILVAGRSWPMAVKVGTPAHASRGLQ